MKIAIVCHPTFGGSGVVASELGLALAKRGHRVHFVSHAMPFRLPTSHPNTFFHEVEVSDYPLFTYPPYSHALAGKLIAISREEALDVIHAHYAIPHAVSAYLCRQALGTRLPKIVTTLHGTDITLVGNNRSFAPVVEFSINKSDGVTSVSQDLKDDTLRLFNVERDIRVIYNFIDFDRFKKVNKDHFKTILAPEGERILVHTSNFRRVKRVEDVIHIFKLVHDALPSKLLMVGDGPERSNAERLCRDLGIGADVRFLGKQDAIEELLAICDLFIMPSENESFGLAALEAMACEVPVVSSNGGGLPEVNIQGVTGFLSEVGDVADMARNAIRLLSDEEMLRQFRQNALAQARRFDIHNILPEYEAYYAEVLEKSAVKVE